MKEKETTLQAIKFTLFSISAGIIQIASFTLLNLVFKSFQGDYGINYIISLLLSIIWNFTFNRKYTFKQDGNVKRAMLLVLLFYAVFTPVTAILGNMLVNKGANDFLILALTMILNFVLEFLYTKFIVYKQ